MNPASLAQEQELLEEIKKMESVFDRVRGACFNKCIKRFAESELTLGEMACVDRCVVKYLKVQAKVESRLQPNNPDKTQ